MPNMNNPETLVKIENYVTYLCFSPDTPPEFARARFVKRYGREPAQVTRDHCLLWVGPVSAA